MDERPKSKYKHRVNKPDFSRAKRSKVKDKVKESRVDDREMLRIQGLTICKECNNPCPLVETKCPTCGNVYVGDEV